MADLDNVPRIVRNETFYFFARICMISASVLGAPLAGYMFTRVIEQGDRLEARVEDQNIALKILNATVGDKLNSNLSTLTDHELRIRALEKNVR